MYPQLELLQEDYYNRFDKHLNYYGSPNSGKTIRINKNFIHKSHNILANFNPEAMYCPYITNSGRFIEATPWQAQFFGRPKKDYQQTLLNSLSTMMAICDEQTSTPRFDELLEMTLHWSEEVQPIHGSAGYCFSYTMNSPKAKYAHSLITLALIILIASGFKSQQEMLLTALKESTG